MKIFSHYNLQNIVTYPEAQLDLSKYPLTKISGSNLDSKAKGDTNAVGKSVLFNTLASVLFNLSRSSGKKNEKSSVFTSKESKASITVNNNGVEYVVTQYFKGASRWEIEKDGKKLKFRETKEALSYIRSRILNMSEQQFYSQVLIDGRVKSLLQTGTSKQRFDYFEDVFRLNAYDALAIPINKEYSLVRQALQELEILDKEHKTKLKDLPELDHEGLKAKEIEASAKFSKIREKIDSLLEERNNVKTFIALSEDTGSKSLKELKEDLAEVEQEDSTISDLYQKAVKFQERKKAFSQIAKKKADVEAQLKELPNSKHDLDEAEEKLESAEDRYNELEEKIADEKRKRKAKFALKEQLEALRDGNEVLFDKYENVATGRIEKVIAQNAAERKTLESSVASLSKFVENHGHNEHCPVCQSILTKSSASAIIAFSEKQIRAWSSRIKKLKALLQYNDLLEQHNAIKLFKLAPMEERLHKLEGLKSTYSMSVKMEKSRQRLQDIWDSLPKMESLGKQSSPPPEVYLELQEGLQKRLQLLQKQISNKLRLKKLNLDDMFISLKEAVEAKATLDEKIELYRPVLDKLQSAISKTASQLSIYSMITKDLDRLQESMSLLKTKSKDAVIYESLRKAFGPRGLRKVKTVFFASKLQQYLNKYAPFIFNGPIKFQIKVSSTNLDILAERSGKIADVRSLSGAESSAFTLLLIVGILPFIKSENRCNLLVLDEIESGMSEPSKQLFVTKFLPLLQQLVPNIYIISPQANKDFYISNCQEIQVVKQNNKSTLRHIGG